MLTMLLRLKDLRRTAVGADPFGKKLGPDARVRGGRPYTSGSPQTSGQSTPAKIRAVGLRYHQPACLSARSGVTVEVGRLLSSVSSCVQQKKAPSRGWPSQHRAATR